MADQELLFETSDFVIKANGCFWRAHKARFASKSTFFDHVMYQTTKEGEECTIDLSAEDPAAVLRMIQFIYVGSYERYGHEVDLDERQRFQQLLLLKTTEKQDDSRVCHDKMETTLVSENNLVDTQLYVLASKYEIPGLVRSTRVFLSISSGWNHETLATFRRIIQGPLWDDDTEFRRMMGCQMGSNLKQLKQGEDVQELLDTDHAFTLGILSGYYTTSRETIDALGRMLQARRRRSSAVSTDLRTTREHGDDKSSGAKH